MKVLYQTYTFNALSKTITFNSNDIIDLTNVLIITNVTTNTIIYNFANPLMGGTILNNVLTLTYNTTTMSNTDKLQIYLDLFGTNATENTAQLLLTLSENIDSSVELLKRIAKIVEPISVQDAQQRQKVVVEGISSGTITTVGTVTTVSTVTNTQSMGGVDYRYQIIDQARSTYSNSIRNNITF